MKQRLLVLGSLVCALALLCCACGGDGGPGDLFRSIPASPALTAAPSAEPTAPVSSAPSAEPTAPTAEPTPAPSVAPSPSPSPSPAEPPAWAAAYIETVNALAQEDPELTYDLIYVDDDDVPELVADKTGYWVYLYTYADGQVHALMEGWGYGAMGNAGYEYAPRANAIHNTNADFAGALCYETYMKIGAGYQLEDYYDQSLSVWYFEDRNDNDFPDEGEYLEDPVYRWGDQVITEAEFQAYRIPGTYSFIQGTMTQDQILAVLENP